MKENKSFFTNNNRLNKGYFKIANPRESDYRYYRKKFEHVLPPIELLEEYETLYPGTTAKLLAMSEKEQIHRHKLEIKNIESYELLVKKGRISSILFIITLAIITALLTQLDYFVASIFASSTIFTVVISILLGTFNNFKSKKDYSHK
ncbi:DUF2335 domain-containing protein [Candidatus Tisiphia endosymbiont of Nemotelus uliginosus]|uniref:DUF2335 domain-containing protein n=1 Tax=Candidatus Tisiphia endosymbiont of Nemotelus uliginosus TaxID=3077926 RepID=UPI0035C910E5